MKSIYRSIDDSMHEKLNVQDVVDSGYKKTVIPCSHPHSWEDGKEYEEGKDYELKSRAGGWFVEGNYSNTCTFCKKVFHGADKLWFMCRECSNEILATPIASNDEDEWVDLQEQVRKHIKEQLFDWDEALTGEEMIYLENLLLTFNPLCPVGSIGFEEQKKHIERLTRKLSDKESNTMEDDSRENVASKAT